MQNIPLRAGKIKEDLQFSDLGICANAEPCSFVNMADKAQRGMRLIPDKFQIPVLMSNPRTPKSRGNVKRDGGIAGKNKSPSERRTEQGRSGDRMAHGRLPAV
jgi:hypothetical protein